MPLTDQARIAQERQTPHILALWRALIPLTSVVSFMNTGAHPDDETSSMLAALGFRDGVDLSYACSTRGEGGQNDIGRESGAVLGTLRTAEMEAACDVLNMRMYWHSQSPDDPITDFGFSKSGVETLANWGHARTLKRFVDILRLERPDIICPTFLDIPGQHGHHRAMTQAAHEVMSLAADPDYPDSTLPIWQVKKFYLPAWSGAGQAYDDDLPPPPETLRISASGTDPVSGFSYARIGQQSRAFHRTQAMGRWVPAGGEQDWPLHLATSHVSGPDTALHSGLAQTIGDLDFPQASEIQSLITTALAAFPDTSAILPRALSALRALRNATLTPQQSEDFGHKLTRKETQLCTLIRIAARVDLRGHFPTETLFPGTPTTPLIEARSGSTNSLTHTAALPADWSTDGTTHTPGKTLTDPYPDSYLPDTPRTPHLIAKMQFGDLSVQSALPFERTPQILPQHSAALTPTHDVINTTTTRRTLTISLANTSPAGANPAFALPKGWSATNTDAGLEITLPDRPGPGLYTLPLTLDGKPAQTVTLIDHPHIQPRSIARPAEVQIRVIDTKIPTAKIGYIGGGSDRVDHWLARAGADITPLTDAELASDRALAQYDSLIIGIFAIRFRAGLAQAMPRLHQWCANGGTLLTLYHRPWDSWDAEKTAPKPLEIGQPSLRWRVTDQKATVTHLAPDHPALTTPNTITSDDWANWHKERGLYFAKSWDAAFTPLLSMADPDEAPLLGSLLSADIDKGRHIHCALILHHQMEHLTPGAFALMANLCAPR